jgi:hypothetical protein
VGSAGHKSHLANAEHALKWIALGPDAAERRVEAKLRNAEAALGAVAAALRRGAA